jgi:hypothetical protein
VYSVGASTTTHQPKQQTQLLLLRFRKQQQQQLIKTTFVKTALNATNDFSAILVDQREHPLTAGVRKRRRNKPGGAKVTWTVSLLPFQRSRGRSPHKMMSCMAPIAFTFQFKNLPRSIIFRWNVPIDADQSECLRLQEHIVSKSFGSGIFGTLFLGPWDVFSRSCRTQKMHPGEFLCFFFSRAEMNGYCTMLLLSSFYFAMPLAMRFSIKSKTLSHAACTRSSQTSSPSHFFNDSKTASPMSGIICAVALYFK